MYSWYENPYYYRNGGFLRDYAEFYSLPRMVEPQRERLRYVVARYADSPAIHSWHYMSELDISIDFRRKVWPATQERVLSYLRFIQEIDPYGHIVSNHLSRHNWDSSFFARPAVQFIHTNAYAGLHGLSEDQIPAVREFSEAFSAFAKPVLIGEYGGHWEGDPEYKMTRLGHAPA
jgi:hypothetical protein